MTTVPHCITNAIERGEAQGKEMQRNIPHKENASAELAFCARDKTRALPTDLIDITTMTCRYCGGRRRGSSDSVGSRGGRGCSGGGSGDGTSGGRISRSGSSNDRGSTLKRIEVPTLSS